MKIDHTKPELYRHIDGRKVVAITELKYPLNGCTHIIHIDDDYWWWNERHHFLIEVKPERWQGLIFDQFGIIVKYSINPFGSIKELKSPPYTHALNLDDLTIHKL